ncbi:hypothetical protein [Streptomyces soliscabiei]|uniref:hypothetical protein n=1 Tax=Streptomyces soliscabiei TaxID=588897 RepID=UPI0029A0C737|nr:hypothetical protein [Streptomyces sp. NY05-11A]MDX2678217.1 hypothetical protein [Streptomyces sp. NY05-11A]
MTSHEFRFECRPHADRGVLEVVPRTDAIPLAFSIDQFDDTVKALSAAVSCDETGAQPIGWAWEGSSRV